MVVTVVISGHAGRQYYWESGLPPLISPYFGGTFRVIFRDYFRAPIPCSFVSRPPTNRGDTLRIDATPPSYRRLLSPPSHSHWFVWLPFLRIRVRAASSGSVVRLSSWPASFVAPLPRSLFSIVCACGLSPVSAVLLSAPAVSSAGAQLPPAFPASLSISRPLYFFVSPPSLLPEAGAVRKGQRASSLMCCALCTVPVGCVVSSAGAFVRGVLHALSWSSSPFVVVCLCQRVLCFVMRIAVARDLACSAFLWRLFCRCKFVMRFVSHDSLIKSGDSWLRASTRQSCDMPACIEARYSVPRGELVHSGCDV